MTLAPDDPATMRHVLPTPPILQADRSKPGLAMQALACYLAPAPAMINSRDVIRQLEAAGWRRKMVKGSHHHSPIRRGLER
jgi:hypothetical protein